MKHLWIYDHSSGNNLPQSFRTSQIDLFPLTGDGDVTRKHCLYLEKDVGITPQTIDAADLVHKASLSVKEEIAGWSSRIGKSVVRGRSIINWLYRKNLNMSTWWLGILSGKNTFQSDAFLNIAQTNSIQDYLAGSGYTGLIIEVNERKLRHAIQEVARGMNLDVICLERDEVKGFKERLKHWSSQCPFLEAVARGLYQLLVFGGIHFQLKKGRPSLRNRYANMHRSLFVSPLPAINPKGLQSGQYINGYYSALQDLFCRKQEGVNWLFHYVGLPGELLNEEIRKVQQLNDSGEKCFFVHEFFSPGMWLKAAVIWVRQLLISIALYRPILANLQTPPAGTACTPILKHLWFESLVGGSAMEGILYGLAFQRFASDTPAPQNAIYCAEMRGWEKAFVAAMKTHGGQTKTIGFQHAAISSAYYHFFYDPEEYDTEHNAERMPLPTFLALTGSSVQKLLENCRYPNTVEVEATRFLGINKALSQPVATGDKQKVFVVAGSISPKENRTLVSLVHQAFPATQGEIEIWFKPHPHCPFGPIFKDLGIDPETCGYKENTEDIAGVLKTARAIIVPTSTVSIEALAYGCEVFIPVVPDGLLMNPLSDFPQFYHPVSSAETLRSEVMSILENPPDVDMDNRRKFIEAYWFTDPELPRWIELIWNNKFGPQEFGNA